MKSVEWDMDCLFVGANNYTRSIFRKVFNTYLRGTNIECELGMSPARLIMLEVCNSGGSFARLFSYLVLVGVG